MSFILHISITLVCCLTMSYYLGKAILNKFSPKSSALLYAPFGFLLYEAIFFLLAIGFVYLHGAWQHLFILTAVVMGILVFITLIKSNVVVDIKKFIQSSSTKKIIVFLVILLGVAHGVIQIGFWNVDNAMSDNSFYVTQAVSVMNNQHMFAVNAADGMSQAIVVTDYFLDTYEISMAFLAQVFGFHPAAFLRVVTPIWMSVLIMLTVFQVFRQLLKKESYAFLGILLYLVFFYWSVNYKNSINDYMLEEWFMYYIYMGKGILRYLAVTMLVSFFITTKEKFDAGGYSKKELFFQVCIYNIISLAAIALSPASCVYLLAIMFVYFLLLLFYKQYKTKKVVLLGIGAAISSFTGVILSFLTRYFTGITVSNVGESQSLLRFLGIGSEYFKLETLRDFFIKGLPTDDYWYPRLPHIMLFVFALIFILGVGIYRVRIAKHRQKYPEGIQPKPIPTEIFYAKYKNSFFFGLLLPFVYVLLYHLPPIVEVVSATIASFGFQRLIGSYPYEIFMITFVVLLLLYINKIIVPKVVKAKRFLQKFVQVVLTCFLLFVGISTYIMFPTRPMTYMHAMSQERRERLKFKDEYYSGKFDYQLLLTNPYKLDYQAEQIVSVLSEKEGPIIVMGTINQFFGLSHVRNYDNRISVVKTRFSKYEDETLADYAYRLKIYFSPWEDKFEEYQEKNSTVDIIESLKAFDTTYLVVIKSYKKQKTFGQDMLTQYQDIILDVEETEQFYIAKLDVSKG